MCNKIELNYLIKCEYLRMNRKYNVRFLRKTITSQLDISLICANIAAQKLKQWTIYRKIPICWCRALICSSVMMSLSHWIRSAIVSIVLKARLLTIWQNTILCIVLSKNNFDQVVIMRSK